MIRFVAEAKRELPKLPGRYKGRRGKRREPPIVVKCWLCPWKSKALQPAKAEVALNDHVRREHGTID